MAEQVQAWFDGRLPTEWFSDTTCTVDRDEVVVVGTIAAPAEADTQSDDARRAAEAGRIARFREQTREERMQIAREAEVRLDRKIAWGVTCGQTTTGFTSVATPVMTRLRQPERIVLDTLVDAGVARSRSHALAWCVRLVGRHSGDWLAELRTAMADVERLRDSGPDAAAAS